MKITIDQEIYSKLPHFHVLAFTMDVTHKDSKEIASVVHQYEKTIHEEYSLEELLNIPLIKEARDAYKKLGKDPSRYRLAVESLYRRVIKGNELYQINNVVDAGNVLSLETKRSVAVLDCHKIKGDVFIRLGREEDDYEGIGRGKLNVSHIPLYEDDLGPFGSTTSDTKRTMITERTTKILLMIICFSKTNLEQNKQFAISLYKTYCNAKNINMIDIEGCE